MFDEIAVKKNLIKYNIEISIRELIVLMFNQKLEFEQISRIEDALDRLSKEEYNKLLPFLFKTAKELHFPLNESGAKKGVLGLFNFIGRFSKNFKYHFCSKKKYMIVVEGDSWFEHFFIKDIINHLLKHPDFTIYTTAYGGDWMGNYIQEKNYLKILLKNKPDFFLLSGGGNDLVGNGRVAKLIHERKNVDTTLTASEKLQISVLESSYNPDVAKKIVVGKKFLNNKFWSILNIFLFQYLLILKSIENEKTLQNIKIITQGYDFGIPNNDKNNLFRKFLGHGHWLYNPITSRGVTNPFEQHAIATAMLYEFNEMLIYLTKQKRNVFHIDCREAASSKDWKDELHLKSELYEKIANTYVNCIKTEDESQKVYKVEYYYNE